jgi:hypothetical protein
MKPGSDRPIHPLPGAGSTVFFPRREIENRQYHFVDLRFVVVHRNSVVAVYFNNALAAGRGEDVRIPAFFSGARLPLLLSNDQVERPCGIAIFGALYQSRPLQPIVRRQLA